MAILKVHYSQNHRTVNPPLALSLSLTLTGSVDDKNNGPIIRWQPYGRAHSRYAGQG